MKINIISIANKMPSAVDELIHEYAKRLPNELAVTWHDIPLQKRSKTSSIKKIQQLESEKMLAKIDRTDHVIALDEHGSLWNSQQLSQQLSQWMQAGKNLSFLIGAPEGLSLECKQRADQTWSLTPLTLPHPLIRPVLIEQLYRAWTILNDHPYHRD